MSNGASMAGQNPAEDYGQKGRLGFLGGGILWQRTFSERILQYHINSFVKSEKRFSTFNLCLALSTTHRAQQIISMLPPFWEMNCFA
jgi:hypothetical protein